MKISTEIPSAVFVGAAATLAHLNWAYRRTQDVDVSVEVAAEVEHDRLIALGYSVDAISDHIYTPRGWKVDIYSRDVSGFSVRNIAKHASTIMVRRGSKKWRINVARLEMLIIMKHRAGRFQDVQELVRRRFADIDWDYMRSIAKDNVEAEEIRNVARALNLM